MLTASERDRFVAWLDAKVAASEAEIQEWVDANEIAIAERFRIKALACRMVALELRSEQVMAGGPKPAESG